MRVAGQESHANSIDAEHLLLGRHESEHGVLPTGKRRGCREGKGSGLHRPCGGKSSAESKVEVEMEARASDPAMQDWRETSGWLRDKMNRPALTLRLIGADDDWGDDRRGGRRLSGCGVRRGHDSHSLREPHRCSEGAGRRA